MVKREQKFLTEFGKEIKGRNQDIFWFKIPDYATRQQVAKPYDVEMTFCGTPVGIEAKFSRSRPRDYEGLLRLSQHQGLDWKIAAGGKAFVFVEVEDRVKNRYLLIINHETGDTVEVPYDKNWHTAVTVFLDLFQNKENSNWEDF